MTEILSAGSNFNCTENIIIETVATTKLGTAIPKVAATITALSTNLPCLNAATILEIAELDIWGQEMPQSTVVVEDIPVSAENVQLLGLAKGNPTLKIECNGVEFMKFKSSEDEYEQFIQPNTYLTVVGTCSKNVWQDVVKPQIMIDDFELKQKWIF